MNGAIRLLLLYDFMTGTGTPYFFNITFLCMGLFIANRLKLTHCLNQETEPTNIFLEKKQHAMTCNS